MPARSSRVFSHWQSWVGVLVCGFCGGIGAYLGSTYFGHSAIPAGVGGGIGGYLLARINRYVVKRYNLDGS
jgi:hypothetical protein